MHPSTGHSRRFIQVLVDQQDSSKYWSCNQEDYPSIGQSRRFIQVLVQENASKYLSINKIIQVLVNQEDSSKYWFKKMHPSTCQSIRLSKCWSINKIHQSIGSRKCIQVLVNQ
jgi:hypothetical protein